MFDAQYKGPNLTKQKKKKKKKKKKQHPTLSISFRNFKISCSSTSA